mgnify:FL=1
MIIETKAPIAIDDLKKHFTDKDISFLIDYKKSDLKGEKLLTYLSNLDLPCDLKNIDNDLMKDYFHSSSIVKCKALEDRAIDILFQFKTIDKNSYDSEASKFVSENLEIVQVWTKKLESLSLYNMYIVGEDAFKDYVENHPKDDTDELEGINFISILNNTRFFEFYKTVDDKNLTYYTKYFNEYMFRGKNLFEYWANENNPLFLLTWDIARGNGKDYIEARNATPI